LPNGSEWPPIDTFEAPYRQPVFDPDSPSGLTENLEPKSPNTNDLKTTPTTKNFSNFHDRSKTNFQQTSKIRDNSFFYLPHFESIKSSENLPPSQVSTEKFRPSAQLGSFLGGFVPFTPKIVTNITPRPQVLPFEQEKENIQEDSESPIRTVIHGVYPKVRASSSFREKT